MLQSGCNYSCPYCGYSIHNLRSDLLRKQRVLPVMRWLECWERVAATVGRSNILITGSGEPTVYPGFSELVHGLSLRHFVSFDTNLSWPEENLRRFLRKADPSRVKVQASFHPLRADHEAFAAKLARIRDSGIPYENRWLAYPPLLGRMEEFRRFFRSRGLRFAVTPFQGPYQGVEYPGGYSPDELRRFESIAEEDSPGSVESARILRHLCRQHLERPAGRACRSGWRYACIMPDGTVSRCLEYAVRGMAPLGNFFAADMGLPAGPSACAMPECGPEFRWLLDPWTGHG